MHSIVQTADLLGINYRTLRKLDPKHLDATLRLETVTVFMPPSFS